MNNGACLFMCQVDVLGFVLDGADLHIDRLAAVHALDRLEPATATDLPHLRVVVAYVYGGVVCGDAVATHELGEELCREVSAAVCGYGYEDAGIPRALLAQIAGPGGGL